MKQYILLFVLLSTTACAALDPRKPGSLDMTPPEGPPEFQQGWVDGCKSALSTVNTNTNLFFGSYEYSLDRHLWQDDTYRLIWKDSYNYCTYFMFSTLLMKM